jgi:hypothetical protein
MIGITYSDSSVTIYGQKLGQNGLPDIGVEIVVYDPALAKIVARDVTRKYGQYSIVVPKDEMPDGKYELRFYGGGYAPKLAPEGDWESFQITGASSPELNPLIFAVPPEMTVSEGAQSIDVNKIEYTVARVTFLNLLVSCGTLASISIFYKRHDASDWEQLLNYIVDASTPIAGELSVEQKITLFEKPSSGYDFQAMFTGGDGGTAKDTGGEDIIMLAENVQFNGIEDLAEYYEVRGLSASNVDGSIDPEEGQIETGVLLNTFANLKWEELRETSVGSLPLLMTNGYTGVTTTIFYEQLQKITGYVVYMYVCGDNIPPVHKYPVTAPGDSGKWYFVAETDAANHTVQCPPSKNVAFWVGFKMATTNKTSCLVQIRENYIS